ncbi:MAG TPA: nucleotidyltransferase family protein, partial [Cyclobacteriaceae bacterium]|nr:nucleotidyltransferase family protein [Cyclobacteriaceae bacterium]
MATEQDNEKVKSVAVILAAGSSSRMGQSKQLLKIGGETLIRKTTKEVIDSGVDRVAVVLGSNQEIHRKEIVDLRIEVITNSNWEEGMGSSIKSGVRYVIDHFPLCQSILFTVCDQPLLTSDHLKKMIHSFQIEKTSIVASFYSDSPGVPALFDRSMFEKLLEIDDKHGAKKIIQD